MSYHYTRPGELLLPVLFILGGMPLDKHCDRCAYSYQTKDREMALPLFKQRQHCRNPQYNARPSTRNYILQDWGNSHCPFWEPRAERKAS